VVERQAITGAQLGEVRVVGHHGGNFGVELATFPAKQQVVQAMAVLAHHQQQARLARQMVKLRPHAVLLAHVAEQAVERGHVGKVLGRLEMHPHEKQPGGVVEGNVTELLGIDDVATGLIQQARDGINNTLGIAARQGQDKLAVIRHGDRILRRRP
jgi:hypothetical protein